MKYCILSLLITVFISCQTSPKAASVDPATPKKVNALNDSLNTQKAEFDKVGKRLIKMMYDYAVAYPKDTLSDDYLFTAGFYERKFLNYNSMMQMWDKVVNDYPNYERMPDVLFYQGYVAENEMKDLPKAKEVYERFLKQFPKHSYAPSIEMYLKNLGKRKEGEMHAAPPPQ